MIFYDTGLPYHAINSGWGFTSTAPQQVSTSLTAKRIIGWRAAKALKEGSLRLKGDERILGDSDFVMEALKASEEELERKYRLKAEGYTLEKLADRVAGLLRVEPKDLWSAGKYAKNVRARSVFCYWAVRELGWSATEIARRIGITQPAVSISLKRGGRIAEEMKLKITDS